MSYYRLHVVCCDQCGITASVQRVGKRQALQKLRDRGWDLNPGLIADMCPECVLMDDENAPKDGPR